MTLRAWFSLWVLGPTRSLWIQVPRALVVSVLAALLDVALLALSVELLGWWPLSAATVSYLAGGVVQYVLSRSWVFHAQAARHLLLHFLAFQLLSLVGLGITWAVLWVSVNWVGVHYLVGKAAALCLAFGWNFGSRRGWLFRTKSSRPPQPGSGPSSVPRAATVRGD